MSDGHLRQVKVWERRAEDGEPVFSVGPARVTEQEARVIVEYLKGAPIVLRTTARKRDAISGKEDVVPQSIRSDGEWVWSDEAPYYIETYLIKPENDFLVHLQSRQKPPSELSKETYSRIASELVPRSSLGHDPADRAED